MYTTIVTAWWYKKGHELGRLMTKSVTSWEKYAWEQYNRWYNKNTTAYITICTYYNGRLLAMKEINIESTNWHYNELTQAHPWL